MTVGELRELLKDAPDKSLVYLERRGEHGWDGEELEDFIHDPDGDGADYEWYDVLRCETTQAGDEYLTTITAGELVGN